MALHVEWSPGSETGTETNAIALGTISFHGAAGGGGLRSVIISGIPVGAILSDAQGHKASGKTAVDVTGWDLSTLSIIPPNDVNFSLTVTGTDVHGNVASASEAIIVNPLAPTLAPVAAAGVESSAIAINLGASVSSQPRDSNSLASLVVSAIPVGAVLSDGTNKFKSTSGSTSVDIHAWNLSSLTITAANDKNFTLTVSATEVDAEGNLGAATTASETVTVKPFAPAVTWAPAPSAGVEGTSIALGTLSVTVSSLAGDSNSLSTLTISGAPTGAVLSDAHGHSHKSSGVTDVIDLSGWTLSSLTVTATNSGRFTLTATATGKDAEGDSSPAGTATETVIVNPVAPVIGSFSPDTGAQGDGLTSGNSTHAIALVGTADAGMTVTVYDRGTRVGATTAAADGSWSLATPTLPDGKHNFTATATDAQGDASVPSAIFAVTIDTTPPSLTPVANQTDEATSAAGAPAFFAATATDLVDGSDPVVFKEGSALVHSGDTFALGSHTITASASDAAGNTASETFTIKVVDTTPPKLTPVADQTDEATGPGGAPAFFAATATDLVDGTDPIVFKEGSTVVHSGDTFGLGTHTITASATDAAGNTASETFAVKVVDTTPPKLTPIADQTDSATSPGGAQAFFAATATDVVDGTDPVVFTEGSATVDSGDTFALGKHTITASATDAAGNTASETFTITVLPTIALNRIYGNDLLNAVEAQQDLVIGGTSTAGTGQTVTITLNGVPYTGLVNGDGSWSVTIPKAALASAALPDGSYLVTANVSDQSGNAAPQASLTLDVHEALPTLAINPIDSNDVLNAAEAQQPLAITGKSTEAVGRTVTVMLNGVAYKAQVASDGTWSVTVPVAALATAMLPDGTYKVTADVTDQYGNAAIEATRTLTVHETPPPAPTFDLSKADQTGPAGSHETPSAVVTLVGQTGAGDTVLLTSTGQTTIANTSGAFQFTNVNLAQGANALTVQATDAAGNTSTYSLTIDRLAPTGTADAAVQWNQIALQAIETNASDPNFASRALAMESLAVFDAVSAIDGTPGYLLNMTAPADADANAAAAQAAHDVLAYLYPAQKATFDAALASTLAAIPDGQGKTDGIALGAAVAAKIIALRASDGWDANIIDDGSTAIGQWRPTAPAYMPGRRPAMGQPDAVCAHQPQSVPPRRPAGPVESGLCGRGQSHRIARRRQQHDAHRGSDPDREFLEGRRRHLHAARSMERHRGSGRAAARRQPRGRCADAGRVERRACRRRYRSLEHQIRLQHLAADHGHPERQQFHQCRHHPGPELAAADHHAEFPGICIGALDLQRRGGRGAQLVLRQ
jgi:hypothetical protein